MADEESRRLVSLIEGISDQEFLRTLGLCQVLTTWALTSIAIIWGPSAFERLSNSGTINAEYNSEPLSQAGSSNLPTGSQPAPAGGQRTSPNAAPVNQPYTANPPTYRGFSGTQQSTQRIDPRELFFLPCDEQNRTLIPVLLPLSVSATLGSCRMVRIALQLGALLDWAHPTTRSTALHLAAANGHVDVARLLLERGAKFNTYDAWQKTPLHAAASNGHVRVVELLLSWGSAVDSSSFDEKTALHWAVQEGHRAVVELLLNKRANTELCMKQLTDGVRRGWYPGGRALHIAVTRDHIDIARLLLDRGAQVDGQDRWDKVTPLAAAVRAGKLAMVELLCERGANPNGADGADFPPLVNVSHGNEQIMKTLLDRGADTERRDCDGDPALHSAAVCGNLSMVKMLVEKGADIHATGAGWRTALYWAVQSGHEEVANYLKEKGATNRFERDISNDSHISFDKVADGKMYEHIEQAQNMMTHESEFSPWAKNLLCVVEATGNNTDFDLDLVRSDDERDDRYIAVSYCWTSNLDDPTAPRLRVRVPDKDAPGGVRIRESRANPFVLRRCMDYARAHGYSRIWIDQECILQDDAVEKQHAIQAMHFVYQQAACTLVILGSHIHTVDDINTLPHIEDPEFKSTKKNDYLIDRIFSDKWWRRAWTTQEWLNSPTSNISYLINWKGRLDVFGIGWRKAADVRMPFSCGKDQKVFRSWELTHTQISRIVHRSMRHTDIMQTISMSSMIGRYSAQKSFNLLDNHADTEELHSREQFPIEKSKHYKILRLNMLVATLSLQGKRNLLVADRLAILGNLARYPYSVDTASVVKNQLSYSASVLATALFNGDLSVLKFNPQRSVKDASGTEKPRTNRFWAPSPELCLQNALGIRGIQEGMFSSGNQIRSGDPAFVIDGKLLVRGLLWDITPFSALKTLKKEVSKYVTEDRNRDRKDRLTPLKSCHELLKLVSKTLLKLGEKDLLELIIVSAMKQQLARPSHITNLMGEIEAWYFGRRDWPKAVFEKDLFDKRFPGVNVESGVELSRMRITLDVSLFDQSEKLEYDPTHPWGNAIIQWMYRNLAQGKPLAVGRCQTETEKLVSLFTVDPGQHKKIFTPLSELEYEFGANELLHLDVKSNFWCVKSAEVPLQDSAAQKGREKLALVGHGDVEISKEIFHVEDVKASIYGVWSPRLFRLGMLKDVGDNRWSIESLGKAASYVWLN